MSRRVRIGILIAIVGVGLAAAGIFVLSRILSQTLAPLPAPTPAAPLTEQVVATTHNLALGTVLATADLKLIDVPVELAPPGAIREVESAVGRITKIDLASGELVLLHHLADPTNVNHDVAFTLADNQVLFAFPANDLMSAVAVPKRGDLVDIFATLTQKVRIVKEGPEGLVADENEEPIEKFLTFDAMQRVEITAMVMDVEYAEEQQAPAVPQVDAEGEAQPQPTPQPTRITIRAYLLAMNPQDALVLKHLKDTGANFDIVLRAPTSDQFFELETVTAEYLIDRYGFELPE